MSWRLGGEGSTNTEFNGQAVFSSFDELAAMS